MSTQILTELPRIQQSGMDFDTVIAEIKDILANNPNWAENWPEFYDSEAGVMLTQLMAWVMDNMSTKQDVLVNEMFLSSAQDDENKLKLLKQIAYNPRLASSSKVAVTISFNEAPKTYTYVLKPRTVIENRINEIVKVQSKDINGGKITWELLKIAEDGKPDYLESVILKAGGIAYTTDKNNATLYALQGETKYEEFTTETSNGSYFDLNDNNIAADSIRVYIKKNAQQLTEVSSFVNKDALDSSLPVPYVVETNLDRTLRIRFGNKAILSSNRLLPAGTTVCVFYRTTSGSVGNINPGFMNASVNLQDDDGQSLSATVKNEILANGGSDEESIDEAVLNGPLSLRTMDRAVTPSDYNIILDRNANVFKSKTYTSSNQPDGFIDYYGRYINPQEAFSIVLLKKNYANVPSSQYNNFPWITLTKEPRLNERYVFDSGDYDKSVNISPTYYNFSVMSNDSSVKTFKNATIFSLSDDFNKALYTSQGGENQLLKVKLSTKKTNESFFDDIPMDVLYPNSPTSAKSSELTMNKNLLKADDNAKFITANTFSAAEPIDVNRGRYITVSFDNKKPITVDLWVQRGKEEITPGEPVDYNTKKEYYLLWTNTGDLNAETTWGTNKTTTAAAHRDGIVEIINKSLAQLELQGSDYDEYTRDTSYQYFGLNMTAENVQNPKIYADSYDFVLEINGELYSFTFSNTNWINCCASYQLTPETVGCPWSSTKGLAMFFNYMFRNNACNLKVKRGTSWEDVEGFPLADIEAMSLQTTNFDTDIDTDNDTSYESIYIAYDLVFKTLSSSLLTSKVYTDDDGFKHNLRSVLWIDSPQESKKTGFIQLVKGVGNFSNARSLIPEPTQAADYKNLASFELISDDSDVGYFKLTSPTTGSSSSIHFKYENKSDFMKGVLSIYFNNAGYSRKAYGQKKLYLLKSDAVRAYQVDSGVETDINGLHVYSGNIIFENSCIYNTYDFETVYANFKTGETSSLILGGVYENFYYSGEAATDDLIKRDVAGIQGQYIAYDILTNGVKSYYIDETKTDLDIRFTKYPVNTNSLQAIKSDIDIIKCDRVKMLTKDISEQVGGFLKLAIDDYDELNIDLTNCRNGAAVTDAIVKAIKQTPKTEGLFHNANTVVRNSYTCLNQVQLQSINNNNGKIVFGMPDQDEETIKHTFKVLFGTNKTNVDFYNLYPKSMFNEDNIINIDDEEYYYCPTTDFPLKFTYRTLVEEVQDDGTIEMVSRAPDYYISIEGAPNGDQMSYRFVLNKTENSRFPDTYFYVHFVNDRSYDFDENGKLLETDENILQNYMSKYKISGTDITFIKPYFRTYDVAATITYNGNFSEAEVVQKVNKAVDDLCDLKNSEIAGDMSRAKILKAIMNVDGVEDCKITYFGNDYANGTGNSDTLKADFYEILCLNDSNGSTTGKIFTFEIL